MKKQKDIFDLFKDNQHKLDERPSSRAWQKLEQRLENRHQRRRPFFFRSMSMAAAVAMLVALVAVISLLFPTFQRQSTKMANADTIQRIPEIIEDLPTYTDAYEDAYKVVEFSRKHSNRLANPVAEGDFSKRLVAQPLSANPAYTARLEDLHDANGAVLREHEHNIQLFKWLLGQWAGKTIEGKQLEEWKLKDRFTMEGQAYLMEDGQRLFFEDMTIKKIGPDLFYFIAVDGSGQQVRYKLKTHDAHLSLFENDSISFPQQVLIRKHSANQYSTVLQNASPSQLSEQQEEYLSKRNLLSKSRAERQLSRENEQ